MLSDASEPLSAATGRVIRPEALNLQIFAGSVGSLGDKKLRALRVPLTAGTGLVLQTPVWRSATVCPRVTAACYYDLGRGGGRFSGGYHQPGGDDRDQAATDNDPVNEGITHVSNLSTALECDAHHRKSAIHK